MTDTYWVTTAVSRTVVHSDKECRQFDGAKGKRKATDAEVERYPECKICSGEHTIVGGSKDIYRSLRDAGKSD